MIFMPLYGDHKTVSKNFLTLRMMRNKLYTKLIIGICVLSCKI